jgi:hypothetical protein
LSGSRPRVIPVVDDDMHAAVVPVGTAIRAAGTAEFAGFDLTLRPERVRNLTKLAQRILPAGSTRIQSPQLHLADTHIYPPAVATQDSTYRSSSTRVMYVRAPSF